MDQNHESVHKPILGPLLRIIADCNIADEAKEGSFNSALNYLTPLVLKWVRNELGFGYSLADAEDITQDVLVKFYDNAPILDGVQKIIGGETKSGRYNCE